MARFDQLCSESPKVTESDKTCVDVFACSSHSFLTREHVDTRVVTICHHGSQRPEHACAQCHARRLSSARVARLLCARVVHEHPATVQFRQKCKSLSTATWGRTDRASSVLERCAMRPEFVDRRSSVVAARARCARLLLVCSSSPRLWGPSGRLVRGFRNRHGAASSLHARVARACS